MTLTIRTIRRLSAGPLRNSAIALLDDTGSVAGQCPAFLAGGLNTLCTRATFETHNESIFLRYLCASAARAGDFRTFAACDPKPYVFKAKGPRNGKEYDLPLDDKDAEAAARFYCEIFPDSMVSAVHRAPGEYPAGKEGDVLTVDFTVAGILNGGPAFKHNEAFSFQIATDDQEETDRYWNAIVGNGGQESACGWCKDKWGISWQITPRVLTEAMAAGGDEAKRAFEAMMTMKKIDVAAIEAARRG